MIIRFFIRFFTNPSVKRERVSLRYAWWALFILWLATFLNYVDRQVIFPMFEILKKEFNLSDTQLGLLGSAFMYVYCIVAIPFARISDYGIRTRIVSFGVFVWSIFTLFSGAAKNFSQLFIARALVGFGEGSFAPSGGPLVCDYFPKRLRNTAMSILTSTMLLGSAVGMIAGGVIAVKYGWRTAFYIAGIPGIIIAIMCYFLKEPVKGGSEEFIEDKDVEKLESATPPISTLFKIPTIAIMLVAQTLLTFSIGGLVQWMFSYAARYWNLSPSEAALQVGPIVIVASLFGVICGGVLADFLNKRTKKGNVIVMALGMLIGSPFIYFFFIVESRTICYILLAIGVFFMLWFNGPGGALQMSLVDPKLRAMISAIFIFVIHFFGDAFSPLLIGILSDNYGLKKAMMILPWINILAALIVCCMFFTVEKDLAAVEERIKKQVGK